MTKKKSSGYVVTVHSKIGHIDVYGDVETKFVEGRPINSSRATFYRSYTDENGVYHIDGAFTDTDHAIEYMYKLVGQAVQSMLRNGWVDIKVYRKRSGRSRAAIIVSVYGKTEDETRGWKQTYGISKDDR